ncbi:MAG TPA: YraN family protein [Candidatus Acidoferrum sp.]|nr:YraN family protein [Candidatus Acidoferrum sp.]
MRTDAQTTGDDAESAVAADLASAGWTILARNVRVGRGELDIVAIDPGPPHALVIVEVRWRRSRAFGLAEETIDHRKRAHLRAAIARLVEDGLPGGAMLPRLPLRADLIVVEPAANGSGESVRIRHHRAIGL